MATRVGEQGVHLRNDQRGGEFAPVADDYHLVDVLAAFDGVLDRLGRDVFTPASLNQVFLAVGDEEVTVGVEVADVARAQPDSPFVVGLQSLSGLGGAVIIATHDVWSRRQNLAVFGDLHSDARDRFADR